MPNKHKHANLPRQFSAQQVKASYAKVAWFYDVWSMLTESKAVAKGLALAQIKDGESILEVAVGTGTVFKEIVTKNPNGINKGIDISPEMLSKAKQRMKGFSSSHYDLQLGSVYKLEFPNDYFDLLVCNYLLDLLPEEDFTFILSEFKRVLKPHGRMLITTFSYGDKWYHSLWYWLAKHFPSLLTGCRPILLSDYIMKLGFIDLSTNHVSQNTFPSEIIQAEKGES